MTEVFDQRQFVQTYLQLISLDVNEKAEFFNTVSTYNSLESLGPTLPNIKTKLPVKGNASVKTVDLAFKSIKPPHKFSKDLKGVADSETIYKVKSLLIESLALDINPNDMKFLVKGKVIQDSVVLSELDSYSFMCMISQTKEKTPEHTSKPESVLDMDIDQIVSISENTWSRILKVLIEDGQSPEKAQELISKFKSMV